MKTRSLRIDDRPHAPLLIIVPTLWCDPRRLDATFGGVMGKYTEQAKLAAVKEYCAGKAGLRDV
ncbi:hypothetical protein, partial [Pseudomonas syringae]|uniref:hypothetical protein n=1 Tax=Pseudomonas syringae TaxID=317 RepID=UPI0011AFBDA6